MFGQKQLYLDSWPGSVLGNCLNSRKRGSITQTEESESKNILNKHLGFLRNTRIQMSCQVVNCIC